MKACMGDYVLDASLPTTIVAESTVVFWCLGFIWGAPLSKAVCLSSLHLVQPCACVLGSDIDAEA